MRYSENLHLNLPEDSDPLEIDKISENFEVLDGAIKEQSKASGYQVGDTLTTYRADLGEEWLLCNGEAFDPDEYQEFDKIRPMSLCLTEDNYRYIKDLKPANYKSTFSYATDGHYQVICTEPSNYNVTLVITDDNFNTVTTKRVAINTTRNTQIFYVNNKWILVYAAQVGDTSSAWGRIASISVADNPLSDWSDYAAVPASIGQIHFPMNIMYYEGKYYVFGMNSGISQASSRYPVVVEMDDLKWTNAVKFPVIPSSNYPYTINTRWSFARTTKGFSIYGLFYKNPDSLMCILQSEKPTGPYSETVITLPDTYPIEGNNLYTGVQMLYNDNKYIYLTVDKEDNKKVYLTWVDGDSMELHRKEFPPMKYTINQNTYAWLFPYKNDRYLFCLQRTYDALIASDLDGSADLQPVDLSTYLGSETIEAAILALGTYLQIGGTFLNEAGTTRVAAVVQIPVQSVPSISISTAYTYIKVTEGDANNAN